jgi:hypothetical protein
MTILKQALEALEKARRAISQMEQRQPMVKYHHQPLRDEIGKATGALQVAISEQTKDLDAVLLGARVTAYKLGSLRVVERTAPGYPSAWMVLNEHSECLGRHSGQFCFEPHPSRITHEWTQAHQWDTAREALQAAWDHQQGGAAA